MKEFRNCILLALLAVCLCSCTNIKAPTAQFREYEITKIGLTKADLLFKFDVENSNNIPLGIKDINYSIVLDGSSFLSGSNEGFSLQAKEKRAIKIPVELNYAQLIGNAMNIVKKFVTRSGTVKYKLEGQLSVVDNVGFSQRVPINSEGEIILF